MSVLHNVVRGAQDGVPRIPQGGNHAWGYCLRRSKLPKWPFGDFGTRSRCHTHPARPPSHAGVPQRAPRPGFSEGLAGYPLRHDSARPPVPTMRTPSVLGVCGWGLAPCTAPPREAAVEVALCFPGLQLKEKPMYALAPFAIESLSRAAARQAAVDAASPLQEADN